jgi:hypothetical protein
MTEPGWYYAQGDPQGTQRYWDGHQWIGDPVVHQAAPSAQPVGYEIYEPVDPPLQQMQFGAASPTGFGSVAATPATPGGYAPAAPAPSSRRSSLWSGLQTLAVILTVLKAIPLVIGALALRWIVNEAGVLDDAFGQETAESFRSALNIIYVVLGGLGALLLIQFIAALTKRALGLFIIGLLLTLLDILGLINSFSGDSMFSVVLMLAVTAAQGGITWWSWVVYRAERT